MKTHVCIVILFALIALCQTSRDRNKKPYKVVCYWGSWSHYRPGEGKFDPEDIDPNICTHIIYGFAKLNFDNTIGVYDSYLDIGDKNSGGLGGFRRFNALRTQNPELSTLIAIGGWNEGSVKYSAMVSNPTTRKVFVDSVVKFLDTHGFDGLDLDWEYPGFKNQGEKGGNPIDKQNFVALLQELRAALDPKGYMLTAAVSAGKPTIDVAYDVPKLSQYLDIINVMAYDFHGAWEPFTGHNAPLHPKNTDIELDQQFTDDYAINYWIKQGADPKKMVMGMPLYGRTFTLAGAASGFKAPASGAGGSAGPYTRQAGILGYNEICVMLKTEAGQWKINRDDTYKVPYAVKGNQWIGYDDIQSIKDKVDFIKSKNLGGGMVWSLETDDFRGLCSDGSYPLMKTIMSQLNGGPGPNPNDGYKTVATQNPNTGTTPTPGTGTTPTPGTGTTPTPDGTHTQTTQATQGGPFTCTRTGFFPDPSDKHKYHECVDAGNGKFTNFTFTCGPGTMYDQNNHVCVMEH